MHKLSIKEMSEKLKSRTLKSVDLTQHYLDRIAKFDMELERARG